MYSYNVASWTCYDIPGFPSLTRLIYWSYLLCFSGSFTNGLKTAALLVWGDCKVPNFEGSLAVAMGEGCDPAVAIGEDCVPAVLSMAGTAEDTLVWLVCMWESEESFSVLLELWTSMVPSALDFAAFNLSLSFWGIRSNTDSKINTSRFSCFECHAHCLTTFKIVTLSELLYYILPASKLNIYQKQVFPQELAPLKQHPVLCWYETLEQCLPF